MKYSAKKLTAQYALTQAAYWMVFCGLYTFATVYLLSKGLTSSKIGIIVACGNLLGFVLQPYISGLADRFQNLTLHYLVEVLIGVMVLAILLLLLLPDVFVLIFLLYVVADALLQVLQPLLNSLSIYYVNAGINVDFGIARGMGSLSFAVMSSILGVMCDKFGANVSMISAILLLLAVFCLVLSMPVIKACDEQKRDKSSNQSSKQKMGIVSFLMHYKRFSMVLFASVLVFIFHNMYNTYLIQVVKGIGGTSTQMGTALTIAAVCELPAMFGFSLIARKFSSAKLMIFATIVFSIKAFATYFAGNVFELYASMVLQMFSFAIITPASVYYVNEVMNEEHRYTGQALMVGTTTVSGVIGSLLGGFILEATNFHVMLLVGCFISVLGTILMMTFARNEKED